VATKQTSSKSLLVEIKDEDLVWAKRQNRYNCAIVRAIQRALPDALHVRADTKEIAFSLPDDDTRYYFQTPPEVVRNVIEPFDKGEEPKERAFILEHAHSAEPINHTSRATRIEGRTRSRRAPRTRTTSGAVHTANRFMDYEATAAVVEEEETQS
jgi:hypothetical protein